jgi:hypothetical protein
MIDRKIILGVAIMITLTTTMAAVVLHQGEAVSAPEGTKRAAAASVATFENDVYVAWWTNKTGNDEVMYRVSSDAGKTFTDKINLSNTPNSDSTDVEISADEGKVAVTWWEHSQTTNEPVIRVSSDGGKTFGPILKLAGNGKIGP